MKTYNGAIATTPSLTPCGTILESAHHQGFSTGLVTNSRLTNPSLSSFYGHSVDKRSEGDLAKFLIGKGAGGNQGKVVDLALGGGKCWFLGNETTEEGSCRRDGEDLLNVSEGIKLVEGMKGLRDWKDQGLLADVYKKKKKNVLGFFSNDVSFPASTTLLLERSERLIKRKKSIGFGFRS